MREITIDQFVAELKELGLPHEDLAFRCPTCGTIQSARDLIVAGAGKDFDDVEKYLAFSCIGRFTNAGSPPSPRVEGYSGGCNWTLGGLLPIHQLTVVDTDGKKHPRFEIATRDEAHAHAAQFTTNQQPSEVT